MQSFKTNKQKKSVVELYIQKETGGRQRQECEVLGDKGEED